MENHSSIPRIPEPWESSTKSKSLDPILLPALILCGSVAVFWLVSRLVDEPVSGYTHANHDDRVNTAVL